jgi:hypothetical protein
MTSVLEGEGDAVVLHPRFGVFVRGFRLYLVLTAVGVALAVSSVAAAAPHLSPRLDHQMAAVGLLFVVYAVAGCVVLPFSIRRTGFYARRGEVGTLKINGKRRLPASPVTHFVRLVTVNKLGLGGLRAMPVTYGLNDSGQRVVLLSTLVNEPGEIEAFIRASALPVKDEAAEAAGAFGLSRRFPMAPDARAQLRQGLLLTLPFLLFLVVGLVFIFLRVQ